MDLESRIDQFNRITEQLARVTQLAEILPLLDRATCQIIGAQRVTLYRRDARSPDIVSMLKTGESPAEIRVAVSFASIAGYTALSSRTLCIQNVRDLGELAQTHPRLQFDDRFDRQTGFRTRSLLSIPVVNQGILLGVLQFINKESMTGFDQDDIYLGEKLSAAIAELFHYQLQATNSPFELLTRQKLIDVAELEQLQGEAHRRHEPLAGLLEKRGISRQKLGESLEAFYQVPWLAYDPKRFEPHPITRNINPKYLRTNRIALLSEGDSDAVHLVIDDPTDASRVMVIERFVGALETRICVGLADDIARYLSNDASQLEQSNLDSLVSELEVDVPVEASETAEEQSISEQDSTIVKLVNRILADGKRFRASDIHIEPGAPGTPADVRMRIDGVCQEMIRIPASHLRATISRIKIMARLDISERRLPQDGKFSVRLNGESQEVRVATIPTVQGEGVVLRLLASGKPVSFEALQLSRRNQARLVDSLARPSGLFLVAGPTGSGKTTTLHALLARLNTPETKIWTAEDPVEITQPGLQQVQVQPAIGFTFAAALRSFLRADPDIILVGEMRDLETASVAAEAALTGHSVLSTLHTSSAPETISRMLDLGLEAMAFADALQGVLAQRLVRKLCPHCRQEHAADAQQIAQLAALYGEQFDQEIGLRPGDRLNRAVGCKQCNQTGYQGRIAVHELLISTPELRDLIYHRARVAEIKQLAQQQGMRTLLQDGIEKIARGDIDLAQLRRVVGC